MHNYKLKRLFLALGLLVSICLLFITNSSAEETLTITTYYPSPYGSYNELTVANREAIGDVNGDGRVDSSDLAVDSSGNSLSGSLTVAGNVGIGTATPVAKLAFASDTTVAGGISFGGDTGFYRYMSGDMVVQATTSGTTGVLRVSPTGSPLTNGSILNLYYTDISTIANNRLRLGVGPLALGMTYPAAVVMSEALGGSGDIPLVFAIGSGGEKMRLDTTGNVGIGTADPTGGKLHVYSKPPPASPRTPSLYIDTWTDGTTNDDSFAAVIKNSVGLGSLGGALYLQSNSRYKDKPGLRVNNTGRFITDVSVDEFLPPDMLRAWGVRSYGTTLGAENIEAVLGYYAVNISNEINTAGYFKNSGTSPNNDYAGYFDGKVGITGGDAATGFRGLQMFYRVDADPNKDAGWIVSNNGSADPLVATRRLVLYGDPVQVGAGTQRDLYVTGRVGIGKEPEPGRQLELSLDSAYKPGAAGTWTIASDKRLKKNIKTLEGALDKILRLHGVTFEWKEPEKQGNATGIYMGLIGQEVEEVFPEWIQTDSDGYKLLTVTGFEALATEAIRQLKAEKDTAIRELKSENAALKARIEKLEDKINNKR